MDNKILRRAASVFTMVALSLVLQACGGGEDDIVVPPVVDPAPQPVNNGYLPYPGQLPVAQQAPGYDYILTYGVPQLQTQWGQLTFLTPVTVYDGSGYNILFVIPAGVYSWAQIYQNYVIGLATQCGCYQAVAGAPTGNGFRGWAYVNFNRFDGYLNAQLGYAHEGANIQLASGRRVDFYTLVNMLVSANYYYYTQVYWKQFRPQVIYYAQPVYAGYANYYGAQPGNSVGAFLGYDSQRGVRFNAQASFSW